MRVVFLLVFLLAWPGGITSNPLPDVVAEEVTGRSGLSTSHEAGVVGPTLEGYLDEDEGLTGDYTRGNGDGVVAGRSRRLFSTDEESGDVPMPKAVVDTKSFEVSSGNDAEVNILAGSKVVIKINPNPFESLSTDSSSPSKLKMDFICGEKVQEAGPTFGFYRDDVTFTSKISVGSTSFRLLPQIPASFDDFVFENSKVTSSKINADLGQIPIPFTAPKCWKNSDGQGVWRAKFSTADSRVKFKVEIENAVVNAGSVTAIGEKPGADQASTSAAGVPFWGWAVIGVGALAIGGGVLLVYCCCCKKKGGKKGDQDKTENGEGQSQKSKSKRGPNHMTLLREVDGTPYNPPASFIGVHSPANAQTGNPKRYAKKEADIGAIQAADDA